MAVLGLMFWFAFILVFLYKDVILPIMLVLNCNSVNVSSSIFPLGILESTLTLSQPDS